MKQVENSLIDFHEVWYWFGFTKIFWHITIWSESYNSIKHFTWRSVHISAFWSNWVGIHQPGVPCLITKRSNVKLWWMCQNFYFMHTFLFKYWCCLYDMPVLDFLHPVLLILIFDWSTEILMFYLWTVCFTCIQKFICAIHKPQHTFVIMIHCYKRWHQNISLSENTAV
jgi:hypothetical protein